MGRSDGSGGSNAICVHEIRANQRTDQTNPLLDQIDRRPMKLKLIAATQVAPQIERAAITQQRAGLVDPGTDYRHILILLSADAANLERRSLHFVMIETR